jgi:hypothetical protein
MPEDRRPPCSRRMRSSESEPRLSPECIDGRPARTRRRASHPLRRFARSSGSTVHSDRSPCARSRPIAACPPDSESRWLSLRGGRPACDSRTRPSKTTLAAAVRNAVRARCPAGRGGASSTRHSRSTRPSKRSPSSAGPRQRQGRHHARLTTVNGRGCRSCRAVRAAAPRRAAVVRQRMALVGGGALRLRRLSSRDWSAGRTLPARRARTWLRQHLVGLERLRAL